MKKIFIILLLFVTVSSYAQNDGTLKTIKVSGVDTAAMLLPYKNNYPRQAISLVFTTTGTSGAATATYSNSTGVFTINIPQYSGGAGYTVNDSRIVFSANGVIKDTPTLVYDRTNGNVGVGLATPLQKLDVNGQLKIGLSNTSQIYGRSDAGQMSIFAGSTAVNGAYLLLNSANPSGFSDSGSALLNYGDFTAVAPTNSLLRFRYVTNGRAYDNLSANALGYVGINTNSAHNTLSVEPRRYNTGQASQSGSTVTGVGTTWTSDMVGDYFKWPSQTFPADRITAVNSTTSLELALEQPIGNATVSDYEILRVGMQVTANGAVGIGTSTPNASAIMDMQSTTKGLLIPRMTNTEMNAISSPATGLQVYNTTNSALQYYNGSIWVNNTTDIAANTAAILTLSPAITISSASTLTLTHAKDYVFSGTTTTWTLPAIDASKTGRAQMITIKNRGSGNITLNTASGSTLYTNALVATLSILPGEAYTIMPDGTYFNVE